MPMTQISLSGLETETDSVTSKTPTLQDMVNPSSMSNTQKDILQIIRKEEDHAMSLLAASPLLSNLFLTYANKAATLDGPSAPSPIDLEWTEMKAVNGRLQEEVASLRALLEKETERAKVAEDCVGALRAQVSSFRDTNGELEKAVTEEGDRADEISFEFAKYKRDTAGTITELRETAEKEAGARAALSQVIADQQVSLAQFKVMIAGPYPDPTPARERPVAREQMKNSIELPTDSKDYAKKSSGKQTGMRLVDTNAKPAGKQRARSPMLLSPQEPPKGWDMSKGRDPLDI